MITAIWCASGLFTGAMLADEKSEDLSAVIKTTRPQAPEAPASKFPEWSKVIGTAKQKEGLFPLYHNEKDQQLFMEIKRFQMEKEFLLPIAIARGSGLMYLGGDTLNFGDQWVVSFRRAADRVLLIRKDVRHKADKGSPQESAVELSYNDSVIASLPIRTEKDNGESILIDLSDMFMTDLAGIGIHPDRSRSTWGKVKGFPQNVEIEVNAVFSMPYYYFYFGGAGGAPDPRGTQIVIHYSLCAMTEQGYRPRIADDRVGHFLSTVRDFSKDVEESPSVRYVTRWNLEKSNPAADRSPPKQPIVFWIEKTVPREYRAYVRDGILEWNKAFDKLGYIDAIQVRDQQADDDFDPEDLRYNTFRWISTSMGFAMGPSRANPRTGQILDADIVFDEGMIRYWRQEYLLRSGLPQGISLLMDGQDRAFHRMHSAEMPLLSNLLPEIARRMDEIKGQISPADFASMKSNISTSRPTWQRENPFCECCQMGRGVQQQIGLAASVMLAKGDLPPGGKVPEQLIAQAVKEVVMHEIGHTLGLRHNFKASTMLSLADCNNPAITREKGMAGSVMDYLPANIAKKGDKQGDYFSTTIGPYDYWAIEYAYKPVSGSEKEELAKIAAKAPQADLTYATDEDMFLNPDPRINLFDLGDPMDYAENRIELVKASLEGLDERTVAEGEGWQRARHAFSLLMGELFRTTYLSLGYVGGQYTARDHRSDADSRPPMQLIPIEK
jgi:hypothetical protein